MMLRKGRAMTMRLIFVWTFAWCRAQFKLHNVFPIPVGNVIEKHPWGCAARLCAYNLTSVLSLFSGDSREKELNLWFNASKSTSTSRDNCGRASYCSFSKCRSVSRLSASTRELYSIRTNSSLVVFSFILLKEELSQGGIHRPSFFNAHSTSSHLLSSFPHWLKVSNIASLLGNPAWCPKTGKATLINLSILAV